MNYAPAYAGAVTVALSGVQAQSNFLDGLVTIQICSRSGALLILDYKDICYSWRGDAIVMHMLGRVIASSTVIAIIALAAILLTSTPATIGPLGILIVFVLMYVSTLGVLTFLLYVVSRLGVRMSRFVTARRPLQAMSVSRSYYFSSVIALVPVILIGMQSVGGIGLYEVILVVVFVVIACVYLAKRTS